MSETATLPMESPGDFGPQAFESLSGRSDLRERQRAVVLAYSRRSLQRAEPGKLLHDAAGLIGETLQMPLRATVELSEPIEHLRLHVSSTEGGTPAIEHRYSLDPADSLAAFTLDSRRPTVCPDLASETRFHDLALRQKGVAAGLLLPVREGDRLFGAIGVLSAQPHHFTSEDIEFADTIAHLLTTTLARIEAERILETARRTLSAVIETSESLVILADLEGRIVRANSASERLTGFAAEELARRYFWSTLTPPDEADQVRAKFRDAVARRQPVSFDCELLTKNGQSRRIRWTHGPALDDQGAAQSMVLTGIDISDRKQLESELAQTQSAKEQAQQELAGLREQSSKRPPKASAGKGDAKAGDSPFEELPGGTHQGLRSSPRRAYPYRQMLAPMWGEVLPKTSDFIEVQFHDISAGGVSFVFETRPDFNDVVLALGCPPNVHHMRAHIVNVAESQAGGRACFLVGCRFLQRVHI